MNSELVTIFTEMAELLAMKEVPFKPRAFEKAAFAIGELSESVAEIYKKGGLAALEEISGVGRGIAERIEEYIKTGHIKDYEKFKKKMPVRVEELTRIEGVGPKIMKALYEKLGIRTLKQLEAAAKAGKIAKLSRFGKKSEEKILKSIAFLKQSGGRMAIGEALPLAREIKARLEKVEGVEHVEIAGSLRRWQETIGDIDILTISSKPEKVMEVFVRMPGVKGIHARGETKSSIRLKQNIDADLRVVPRASFGAALQYFTGNKAHNVALRKIAIEKGYKLNEYGLFRNQRPKIKNQNHKLKTKNNLVAGKTEEEIYKALGLHYIEPEMRLDEGEIELVKQKELPSVIGYNDIKGDLQTQTNWTDGAHSIEEMARAAAALGHEYIAITDHTKGLAMTGGSDEAKLLRQMKEIDKINKAFSVKRLAFRILTGAEVNIKKDGSLDIDDETLAKLDVVGAAIHSHFKLPKKEQTERLIRAIENPHVDIIFHPTGRIVQRREPIELDIEQVLKAAARTGTAMEINAHPWRLDLKDEHIRLALKLGVKLVIDTDAHSVAELGYLEYGIAQARRAGATKKDILNTKPLKEFLQALK